MNRPRVHKGRKGIASCGKGAASTSDRLASEVGLACDVWLRKKGLIDDGYKWIGYCHTRK